MKFELDQYDDLWLLSSGGVVLAVFPTRERALADVAGRFRAMDFDDGASLSLHFRPPAALGGAFDPEVAPPARKAEVGEAARLAMIALQKDPALRSDMQACAARARCPRGRAPSWAFPWRDPPCAALVGRSGEPPHPDAAAGPSWPWNRAPARKQIRRTRPSALPEPRIDLPSGVAQVMVLLGLARLGDDSPRTRLASQKVDSGPTAPTH